MHQPKDIDWMNGYKNKIHLQETHLHLQESHLTSRGTCTLKVRQWKKIFHVNRNQKKPGVAILISDKIDLKIKNIVKDKARILHNDQMINPRRYIYIYVYNIGSPQYIRQLLTKVSRRN